VFACPQPAGHVMSMQAGSTGLWIGSGCLTDSLDGRVIWKELYGTSNNGTSELVLGIKDVTLWRVNTLLPARPEKATNVDPKA